MGKKLTYNERIGLLLTGILIILVCIALAIIPRRNAQPPIILPSEHSKLSEPSESSENSEPSNPSTPSERNPLNEAF